MSNTALVMVLAAAVLHASWNAIVKGAGDRALAMAMVAFAHVLVGGIALVFVPSFYTIMDDAALGVARLFRWLVRPNPRDEPEEAHGSNVHLLPKRDALPVAAE